MSQSENSDNYTYVVINIIPCLIDESCENENIVKSFMNNIDLKIYYEDSLILL